MTSKARFPSGQRGRTVNPLAKPSQVRILLSPPYFAKVSYSSPAFYGMTILVGVLMRAKTARRSPMFGVVGKESSRIHANAMWKATGMRS